MFKITQQQIEEKMRRFEIPASAAKEMCEREAVRNIVNRSELSDDLRNVLLWLVDRTERRR